jgi:hypothetical protein
MKQSYGRSVGVVSVNSDVIERVIFMGEASHKEAVLEIEFCNGKTYEITGRAAGDVWATFNLAVSNNESIGQWFNREVKNQHELVLTQLTKFVGV